MVKSIKKTKEVKYKIKELEIHSDKRGWFLEMLKRNELDKDIKQVSVATLKPGVVRGNHYHLCKKEWFLVIGGKASFCLGNPNKKEKICFNLSSKRPKLITVFPKTAHAIKNISKKIIYFIEADSAVYNHKRPDALPFLLLQ